MSGDAIVPDAANPQDFNRYSYVQGNPLKYTDPSGNICIAGPVAIGCAIGLGVAALVVSVVGTKEQRRCHGDMTSAEPH